MHPWIQNLNGRDQTFGVLHACYGLFGWIGIPYLFKFIKTDMREST